MSIPSKQHRLRLLATLALASFAIDSHAAPDIGDFDMNWGNGNGKRLVRFDLEGAGQNKDYAAASLVASDGTMFIAGTVYDNVGVHRFGIAKLTKDGVLDADFGPGGADGDGRNTSLRGNIIATSVAISPDETRVFIGGYTLDDAYDYNFIVCQFSATTGANINFSALNNSSCAPTAFAGGSQDIAADIVVQDDGRIVVAGSRQPKSSTDVSAAFVRLMPDGSRDTSFGRTISNNLVTIRTAALYSEHVVNAVTVATDGRIVAVGETLATSSTDLDGLVITLEADGTDASEFAFDAENNNLRNTQLSDVIAMRQPVGMDPAIIVVGKSEGIDGKHGAYIGKLLVDGGFDDGFGTNGQQIISAQNFDLRYSHVAQQANQAILVLGVDDTANDSDLFVQRFTRTGELEPTFAGAATRTTIDFETVGGNNRPAGISVAGNAGVYVGAQAVQNSPDVDFFAAKLQLETFFADSFE